MREGYFSSNGVCFDIGGTIHAALDRFERSGEPWCGSADERSAGNGSIMRLAPVPLFFAHTPEVAIARSADSSRTTHGATEAIDACRYMAGLIIGALQGRSKEESTRAAVSSGSRSLRHASRSRRRLIPLPRVHSSEENRRTSADPATSSNRSKPRCGRSGKAHRSSTERFSPSTWAGVRITTGSRLWPNCRRLLRG